MSQECNALPSALLRFLADSEIEVVSWNEGRLTLQITKEIGPERGVLEFTAVTHANLPSRLGIAGIRLGSGSDLSTSYFETHRLADQSLDSDERVFLIDGSWGGKYFVIARAVKYTISD